MSAGNNIFIFLLLIVVNTNVVFSQSSLTFVIDETGSMWDEIDQVKAGAKDIFDTVMKSNASQIEDFVLVTFSDPGIYHRTTTKDLIEFKNALSSINVDGGGDCPEMCMSGIETALRASRSGSLLYVFTDASAKDYEKYEIVKALAQKKLSQIVFVLTGMCEGTDEPGYAAYVDLAKATSGQVFHLDNDGEVHKILKYVEESVKSRKTVIANVDFPPGPHELKYEVDGLMKELVISVTGKEATVRVVDPDGNEATTEDIMKSSDIAVVKVTEVKPGTYTAEVNSKSTTSVVVTGATTLHFQYGFAQIPPTSIEDTATRPLPDQKSYIAITLTTEGGDVSLQSLQIRDMDNKVLKESVFKIKSDHKNQFYVTDRMELPKSAFRIAIKGYDAESKTTITRISLTPIEPQIIDKTEVINKAPEVALVGESKVIANYDTSVQLKCKVNAYPTPTVSWEDMDGNIIPSTLSVIELPRDFISVANIDHVKENKIYKCKASNAYGEDMQELMVEMNTYFNIVERPKSADVPVNEEVKFSCKIDANPPVSIEWFKETSLVEDNGNIMISPDKTILTIRNMMPEYAGNYLCAVRNEIVARGLKFHVGISGIERPEIDKSTYELHVGQGSDIQIACRLLRGIPKPTVRWFYQRSPTDVSEEIDAGGKEYIILRNVTPSSAGTYRCEALNEVGTDIHYTDLFVEYPPEIKRSKSMVLAKEGDKIRIPCVVKGAPTPEVKWFANDTEVDPRRFRVHNTNSLNFRASIFDTGYYRCQATNTLGTANSVTQLNVAIPPKIEVPSDSLKEVNIGTQLSLPCVADGYPKPSVQWTFYSMDPKIPPQKKTTTDASNSLILRLIQLEGDGYYTCHAENLGGSANITYEVKVYAPPKIRDVYPETTFKAVVGDVLLRILCETTGNPKPDIFWIKDEVDRIPAESEFYDIEKTGALLIKNVDKEAAGFYTCNAVNRMGSDNKTFEVIVDPYPEPRRPTATLFVEKGNSVDIPCRLPHKKTDSLRWYKSGVLIHRGELSLQNATISDAGLYSCRVSTFSKSRSGHVQVKVGFKPRFIYPEDEHVEFEEGHLAVMDCNAEGDPTPEISWWHNGKQIAHNDMIYTLEMKASDIGTYFCLVKNGFGSVNRQFEISSRDCMLNIESDFTERQPLVASYDLQWPSFDITDKMVKIQQNEEVRLSCPSEFENFPTTEILTTCIESKFEYNGRQYDFQQLKCKREIEPIVKETGSRCLSTGNTERILVGHEIRGIFLEVYSICFDKDKKVPIYAKQSMNRDLANVELKRSKWFKSDLLPFGFDSMYNCNLQIRTISAILGYWFHLEDNCCFAKRQLVDSRDVLPGVAQAASYSYLNVVPQWSSCNSKNWDTVEQLVRDFAKASVNELNVWTGTSKPLKVAEKDISIIDQLSGQQPVSQFLWKVVQNPETQESVAIIHVNVPDLSYSDAYRHMLCPDVCNEIDWMGRRSWRDVINGFIYCCHIKEFELRFGLDGIFDSGLGKLLYRNATAFSDIPLFG